MEEIKNIPQLYKELLYQKLKSIENDRKSKYNKLVSELSGRGLVKSSIHIKEADKIEITYIKEFIDYAIIQFKRMITISETNINDLEKIYIENMKKYINEYSSRMEELIKKMHYTINMSDYIKKNVEDLENEAVKKLEITKAEIKFGLEKTTSPITITESAIGLLNLGIIIGNIEDNIAILRQSGHVDIAEIIKIFMDEIEKIRDQLTENNYQEILSLMEFITEQANKDNEKRNIFVIKNVFQKISQIVSTASDLANIWEKIGSKISTFFGFSIK